MSNSKKDFSGIYVTYIWYKSKYEFNNVSSSVSIENVKMTKKGVAEAINKFAKDLIGSGYITVSKIATTYNNSSHIEACKIKKKKFLL